MSDSPFIGFLVLGLVMVLFLYGVGEVAGGVILAVWMSFVAFARAYLESQP